MLEADKVKTALDNIEEAGDTFPSPEIRDRETTSQKPSPRATPPLATTPAMVGALVDSCHQHARTGRRDRINRGCTPVWALPIDDQRSQAYLDAADFGDLAAALATVDTKVIDLTDMTHS